MRGLREMEFLVEVMVQVSWTVWFCGEPAALLPRLASTVDEMGKRVRDKEDLLFSIITHSLKGIVTCISLLTVRYTVTCKHFTATRTIPIASFLWRSSNETVFLLPSVFFHSMYYFTWETVEQVPSTGSVDNNLHLETWTRLIIHTQ